MAKWWMALVLGGLGLLLLSRPALGQMPPGFGPTPAAAPASPGDPVPLGTSGAYPYPSAAVGGLSLFNKEDKVAGNGAVPPPTLTNDGTPNAFESPCDCPCERGQFYVTFGSQALRRLSFTTNFGYHFTGQTNILAVQDPGVSIPGFPQFFHTGIVPPPGEPVLLYTSDVIPTTYTWGGRATIGYQFENSAIEISGFMQPTLSGTRQIVDVARIDLPFGASPVIPLGFEGDNNFWLQTDLVRASFRSRVGGAEANYRMSTNAGFEWLLGLRYLNVSESYSIFVDDDSLETGIVDPTKIGTYSTTTNNNLVCPQIGLEGEWPILSWLAIGGWGKAALGPNFVQTQVLLQRGDGFVAPGPPNGKISQVNFGQIYELGAFVDLLITERIRVRAGYQAFVVLNVAEAADLIDSNLGQTGGTGFTRDGLLYYGPMFELSLAF